MKARIGAMLLALVTASCTSAGPFVTSISSDGRGNLVIDKSMVTYNNLMGTISNEESTTSTIRLYDQEALDRVLRENGRKSEPYVWNGE